MPKSMTTSSRVLVTLQTFAYELFIAVSSHLIRAPCCSAAAFTAASADCFVAIKLPPLGNLGEYRIYTGCRGGGPRPSAGPRQVPPHPRPRQPPPGSRPRRGCPPLQNFSVLRRRRPSAA